MRKTLCSSAARFARQIGGVGGRYKPDTEQLSRLPRVPWKSKRPVLDGPLCRSHLVLAYHASAIMRACHHSNASSGMPAQILALPMLLSGSNVAPLVCSVKVVCTSYEV